MRERPIAYTFRHLSDTFTFGTFQNLTLSDVIDSESGYLEWCIFNIPRFILEDEAMNEIRLIYPGKFCSTEFEKARLNNIKLCKDLCKEVGNWEDEFPDDDFDIYEKPTYERYRGSWAQDEMGYSDDDIDTIFDGDPDAYWNID